MTLELSSKISKFLAELDELLHRRVVDSVRLCPLILEQSAEALLGRRKRLFAVLEANEKPYGYEVLFKRRLKPSKEHPEGRECAGLFHLLTLPNGLIIVATTLSGDDYLHGPKRFVENAYPLARRPFFPSTSLVRLIEEYAAYFDLSAVTLDVWGYHRKSRRPRRDLECQSPASAGREMAAQGRLTHRMDISFRRRGREVARIAFDRNALAKVKKGSVTEALNELVIPGVIEATKADDTYKIARAAETGLQETVELEFTQDPFNSYESMKALCDAVRKAPGLNVAIIHLNPYLQAQVLDFYTGEAIELLITDSRNVSLIPRSRNGSSSMQRVATSIFRHFGEAKPKRGHLTEETE